MDLNDFEKIIQTSYDNVYREIIKEAVYRLDEHCLKKGARLYHNALLKEIASWKAKNG